MVDTKLIPTHQYIHPVSKTCSPPLTLILHERGGGKLLFTLHRNLASNEFFSRRYDIPHKQESYAMKIVRKCRFTKISAKL